MPTCPPTASHPLTLLLGLRCGPGKQPPGPKALWLTPHGPPDAGHAGQALSLQLVPSWVPGPEAVFVPAQGRLSSSPVP